MVFTLYDLLTNWENLGFFDIALPFLLVFTIAFAVLEKSKILGTTSKSFNAIVALILGFLFVRNGDIPLLVHRFLPNISFFIVVIIMGLLVMGMFLGDKWEGFGNKALVFGAILAIILVFWSLYVDVIYAPYWFYDLFVYQDIYSLAALAVVVLVIWVVFFGGKKREGSFLEKIGRELRGGNH